MNNLVSEYIDKQKSPQREILMKLRGLIRELVPEAEEKMSYGVPAFKLKDKSVLYAAFKEHVGLYPEPDAILAFKEELKDYQTSKGTIKFAIEKPIPYDLISKIVMFKLKK